MSTPDPSQPRGKVKKGEALWLMSFSDMALVLLCFFVLLISVMKPNKSKFENVKDGMQTDEQVKEKSLKSASKEIKKVIKEKKLNKAASVEYDAKGLHIEFKDGLLFEQGSSVTNQKFRKTVNDVLQTIASAGENYKLIIEGHTDDVPLASGGQYPSNWELAASRGVALLRSLEAMGVSESKMSVVSYAHTRPKIPYRNLSGSELRRARAANRRVVIWLE